MLKDVGINAKSTEKRCTKAQRYACAKRLAYARARNNGAVRMLVLPHAVTSGASPYIEQEASVISI